MNIQLRNSKRLFYIDYPSITASPLAEFTHIKGLIIFGDLQFLLKVKRGHYYTCQIFPFSRFDIEINHVFDKKNWFKKDSLTHDIES